MNEADLIEEKKPTRRQPKRKPAKKAKDISSEDETETQETVKFVLFKIQLKVRF